MKNFLIKNWKTTLIGLSVLILVALYVFKVIGTEQFLTIFGTLTGLGLFASKDGDKTGVSINEIFADDIAGGGGKNPPPKKNPGDGD